jgi:hypothetical protein
LDTHVPAISPAIRDSLDWGKINRFHDDAIDATAGLSAYAAHFFAQPFASQSLFDSLFFARLQIEGMLFDVLNDVFLLNFALEAPKRAFEGFTFI